ncbi:23S rRNA (cytidine1920-2'-O)/16S rRNA (cytidine1409-2'-O)-methyltransferase [Formivibrio citricus]|uniref:23S rRNA (Cytidine1920-2'-O)/16S rRNA (Cytidine1409-2'-O)-methyltransferase n=1 Tax=Formivibrio citricus TaxID=83765 RepID=A0A1I5DDQ3_9NEIS|nr:TlyA family RNA methyltransferase [Formivibrio citricus]SFN97394.1 23S rRNA (cytidine1920-2'-O)/16S rRNA (cytidine1409-2'-O)-methyltransferase [Formivibrio citricus]
MKRADLLLVELGLAPSRTAAQNLIEAGRVAADGKPVVKPSQKLDPDAVLHVEPDPADRFVSRGGLKLAGALEHTGLDVRGMTALDVGISTGGFTDCLLQAGARKVVGVEVGHDQLHPRLLADARVAQFEGVNARHLTPELIAPALDAPLDLVVGDVSFISLTLVLPALRAVLPIGGKLLFLVKPQFEVGPGNLGKGGIVKNEGLYPEVEARIVETARACGFEVLDYLESPIKGGDGNREFFLFAVAV